jgi:hypothetical protein
MDTNENGLLYLGSEGSSQHKIFIEKLAKKIAKGDVILFIGASANCPPPKGFEHLYAHEHRPPMGGELADMMANDINYTQQFPEEKYFNLSRIAQYYELTFKRPELVSFLQEKIENKKPSPLIHALAEMPFKYIMTTNYDHLLEQALRAKNKTPLIGIYKPNRSREKGPQVTTNYDESEISEERPFLYKIHGDIGDGDSMVISDEDYIHFILRMRDKEDYNPIPHSFTNAFGKKTILFVGYGLMDYNLRLLFKIAMWGKDNLPLSCSIDKKPDKLIMELFENNYSVKFFVEDAWRIIPLIYKYVMNKEMPLECN